MSAPRVALIAAAILVAPTVTHAQSTRVGFSGGLNFVGGGASRTGVDVGGTTVTGADRQGKYVSAFLERHGDAGPLGMRLEAFYGRLTSGRQTWSPKGRPALRDETFGAVATLVYSLSSGRDLTPYTLLGAGLYATSLGTNPDPSASTVSQTARGMGLGMHVGAGLEWQVRRTHFFAEWRFQQALHQTRGGAFMPFVLGVKF
jgi:hypothetical protein